jgi:hypothetical protein
VGQVPVVVLDVLAERGFEVKPPEDEHPIEALAPDCAHESLGDDVRPPYPDRDIDDPDRLCGEDGVEGGDELRVSVTDQELDRRRPIREFHADVPGLWVCTGFG